MELSPEDQADSGVKKSRRNPQAASPPQKASLEGLPAELRVKILQDLDDIPTLSALVHSSPVYHQAYVGQRRRLLLSVLLNELSPKVFLEASLVLEAASIRRGKSEDRWITEVESFVEAYHRRRTEDDLMPALELPDLDTLIGMAQTQHSMRHLAHDFYEWTLSEHPIEFEKLTPTRLSRSELRRIYRACYRFEIYSFLFWTLMERNPQGPQWGHRSGREAGCFYFLAFELWEVEEVYCLREYIYRRYDTIFKEGKEALEGVFYRLEERDSRPGQTEEEIKARMTEKDFTDYAGMTETLMGQGLELLSRTIRLEDPRKKILEIEPRLGRGLDYGTGDGFLTTALRRDESIRKPQTRQEAEKLAAVPFTNDHDENSPNAAWPWSLQFNDQVSNFGASFHRKESLRSWGYVMWDKERLDSLGIMEKPALSYDEHGPLVRHGVMLTDGM